MGWIGVMRENGFASAKVRVEKERGQAPPSVQHSYPPRPSMSDRTNHRETAYVPDDFRKAVAAQRRTTVEALLRKPMRGQVQEPS
jgi:hypothetical protein